jgi:hypothetical protein
MADSSKNTHDQDHDHPFDGSPEVQSRSWTEAELAGGGRPPASIPLFRFHWLDQGIMDLWTFLYFRRHEGRDELWEVIEGYPAHNQVYFRPASGTEFQAALWLVEGFMRNFGTPSLDPDRLDCFMINSIVIGGLVRQIEREEEEAREAARRHLEESPSPLIAAARELGLDPRPTGGNDVSWIATCPGRNHWLMLTVGSERFGCGYCKVSGGPEELRALVEQRRTRPGK